MGNNNTNASLTQDWLRRSHGYTAPAFCIVGFLGNMLGSVVLSDMEVKAPITTLMTGLAVSNAMTLIVYIPFAMLLLLTNNKSSPQSAYAQSVMSVIAHVFMTTSAISNWLTVTIAVYMLTVLHRICDPLKTITTSRASHINWLMYLVVTAMTSPNYHDALDKPRFLAYNVTVWTLGAGYGTGEKSLLDDFSIVVNSVLMRLIPCLVLTIVVITVVREMRQALKVSGRLSGAGTTEARRWRSNHVHSLVITRTLIAVLVIFTATEASNGVLMLLAYNSDLFFALYTSVGHVMTTLALINYGVTFLLYSFMSYQFREACRQASCQQVRSNETR